MLRIASRRLAPSDFAVKALATSVAALLLVSILLGVSGRSDILVQVSQLNLTALLVFLVLIIVDGFLAVRRPMVLVERVCAKSVPVDRWTKIRLVVHHRFSRATQVILFDDVAQNSEFENLPLKVLLIPNKKSSVSYRMKVLVRGPCTVGQCHVKAPSPLLLWDSLYRAGHTTGLKVYPDFSAITAYILLATDNHESRIGIKRKPRRGEGLEFLQLRDYRSGDALRQIDWKATARRQKLISKEYQDERDQQVVLLIDSGRRMRGKDDTLSHFDHSLNALLLVSYIALRQGDSVSVMSFGNTHRWVAAQKGIAAMKTILNEMYDLQAESCASDYVAVAEKLSALQRKRSLVVLVTNSRDEDVDELLMAAGLIQQRHVLLLANIREAVVDALEGNDIGTLDDALTYAGLHQYLKHRQEVQQKIINRGVYSIDCVAEQLAVRLANSYLEIKRSGVL